MNNNWNTVDILRFSRHDWLNRLQLIKGNLALNKLDRVNEIINEIAMVAEQESKLTNLHTPLFAGLLLTYGWDSKIVHLEYEIIGDIRDLSEMDKPLFQWCNQFLTIIEKQANPKVENHLCISIEIHDENVKVYLDYRGLLKDKQEIISYLTNKATDRIASKEMNILDEEITVVIEAS